MNKTEKAFSLIGCAVNDKSSQIFFFLFLTYGQEVYRKSGPPRQGRQGSIGPSLDFGIP